jgi:predicted dehydrogenase
MTDLRIGVLGAARIASAALVKPARRVPGVEVTAAATRDGARARALAARHGIATVHESYDALVEDPRIDAVVTMRLIDEVYRAAGPEPRTGAGG